MKYIALYQFAIHIGSIRKCSPLWIIDFPSFKFDFGSGLTGIAKRCMLMHWPVTAQTYQAQNIRTYVEYIQQRAISFGHTKVDFVRGGEGRLKRLTVDKGLLRETESVQDQIKALLRCEVRLLDHTRSFIKADVQKVSLSSSRKRDHTYGVQTSDDGPSGAISCDERGYN